MKRSTPLKFLMLFCCVCFHGHLGSHLASTAQADDAAQLEFFEKKIRPVLVQHCYACHAADSKQLRGGLLVDSKAGLQQGGDSGVAVVPHAPEKSLLLEALKYESFEMPPEGKLPNEVIQDFETWIAQGAIDPRTGGETVKRAEIDLVAGREFWSFRPLTNSAVPTVQNVSWPQGEIDQFLLSRMEARGLAPVSDAAPEVLLRRLFFDLIGLPPTPEQITAYLQDSSPAATERIIDELLASQHFGERWGRHWLDIVRYSDSTGGGRSAIYGDSWKFRNYVIDAFNSDKPFNQFILEHIAGDLLPADDPAQAQTQITGTAFLAMGPTNYELQDKVQLQMDVIDEQIDTIGKAFLGMTIGCARCHDHKFDPIPTADYYAMVGIFRSTTSLVDGNVAKWITRPVPESEEARARRQQYQAELAELKQRVEEAERELQAARSGLKGKVVDDAAATLTGAWTPSTSVKGFVGQGYQHSTEKDATATFQTKLKPGSYLVRVSYTPGTNRSADAIVEIEPAPGNVHRHTIDQRQAPLDDGTWHSLQEYDFTEQATVRVISTGNNHTIIDAIQFVELGAKGDSTPTQNQLAIRSAQEHHQQIVKDLKAFEKLAPPAPPTLMSVLEEPEPADFHICIRGNVKNLGPVVPRGFLQVLMTQPAEIPNTTSGRLQLAEWITDEASALTARVFVNRVWHHLFGAGIVRSVDNFGSTGEAPSHPELLDFLALQFIESGWSVKALIREIVLTHAYRLSSASPAESQRVDPDNRLLTHQRQRRLEAEALYDAMMLVSGQLDRGSSGQTVRKGTTSEYNYDFEYGLRGVYLPVFRNCTPDLFAVFDFPDPNLSLGQRTASTLSTQSLYLLNSPLAMSVAKASAAQVMSLDLSTDDRLDWIYLAICGRYPLDEERSVSLQFLASSSDTQERWQRLCQALYSTIDFRYLR